MAPAGLQLHDLHLSPSHRRSVSIDLGDVSKEKICLIVPQAFMHQSIDIAFMV